MAQFDFVVDTNPMAQSVDGVSMCVNATIAAVTTMQAAVIEENNRASKDICDNVDRGFYSLIRSQVSLKVAKYYTEINAKTALLLDFTKALLAMKSRMESDVNRLKREYRKIFKGLDKALENRIFQLDRDAMRLAEVRKNLITSKIRRDVTGTITSAKDINNTVQLAVMARTKKKTGVALERIGGKVGENQKYVTQLNNLLEKKPVEKQYMECIPVIYVNEQSMVSRDANVIQMYFPDWMSEETKNTINMEVVNIIEPLSEIDKKDNERQEIYKEFKRLLATSNLDERTAEVVKTLFQNGGCR